MPTLPSRSPVTEIPALSSADALRHFSRLLELETDCWDVHASLESGGFVLLDVRSAELFRRGHARGAVLVSAWGRDLLVEIAGPGRPRTTAGSLGFPLNRRGKRPLSRKAASQVSTKSGQKVTNDGSASLHLWECYLSR